MTPREFFRRLTRRITRWPLYVRADTKSSTISATELHHSMGGHYSLARLRWAVTEKGRPQICPPRERTRDDNRTWLAK